METIKHFYFPSTLSSQTNFCFPTIVLHSVSTWRKQNKSCNLKEKHCQVCFLQYLTDQKLGQWTHEWYKTREVRRKAWKGLIKDNEEKKNNQVHSWSNETTWRLSYSKKKRNEWRCAGYLPRQDHGRWSRIGRNAAPAFASWRDDPWSTVAQLIGQELL